LNSSLNFINQFINSYKSYGSLIGFNMIYVNIKTNDSFISFVNFEIFIHKNSFLIFIPNNSLSLFKIDQDAIIIRKHLLDLNNVYVDHENGMLLNFLSWQLISIKLKVNVPWGYHSCEMTVASTLLITTLSLFGRQIITEKANHKISKFII